MKYFPSRFAFRLQTTASGRYGFLFDKHSFLGVYELDVRFIFAVKEVKKHSKSRASPSRPVIMITKMVPIP